MCQTGGASKRWLAPGSSFHLPLILAVKKTAATLRRSGRWTQVNIPKCGTLAWPNAAWLHRKWAEKTFRESQVAMWALGVGVVWKLGTSNADALGVDHHGTAMSLSLSFCRWNRWNRWDPRFPERYDGQSKGRGESHGGESQSCLIQQKKGTGWKVLDQIRYQPLKLSQALRMCFTMVTMVRVFKYVCLTLFDNVLGWRWWQPIIVVGLLHQLSDKHIACGGFKNYFRSMLACIFP